MIIKYFYFHQVEVFESALEQTPGDDLSKLLWLKSPSSEVWFDRRTNYTRSLAVMSMVGYILGLGDRHPSNLMLDRLSGKILHIDFGDCFEVNTNLILEINHFFKINLFSSKGCNDTRKIPRKNSIPFNTHVNQSNGGNRH